MKTKQVTSRGIKNNRHGRRRFSKRAEDLKASGIRKLFDRAHRIPGAIDLSIGQAHFDVPDEIKEATINAIRSGCGGYGPTQGDPHLIEATRQYLKSKYGLSEDEELLMTSGATGAIVLALLALVEQGDEVLLPDPYFILYHRLVRLFGGIPVFYDLYPDFRLRASEIEKQMSDRARLFILNTPSNPTGAVFSASEIEEVADLCRSQGVTVLSDELYEIFVYDAPHVSIKQFLGPESLLVGGFSKAYGMAGWRLGWAAGAPELIDRMRTLQQFVYACPPTLVQKGSLAAFDVDMKQYVDDYRRKRDFMYEGLVASGYEVVKPGGSFFIYPRVPWGDDLEFCERAIADKLIIVPGRNFSRRLSHVRVSIAAPDETLERGLEVFCRLRH
ncbi:MAG: pyridoxal phosphate-dependent aminotransferase [Candidatus Glassbacteria bacterium]